MEYSLMSFNETISLASIDRHKLLVKFYGSLQSDQFYRLVFCVVFLCLAILTKKKIFKYKKFVNNSMIFSHSKTEFNQCLVDRLSDNVGGYQPPWWYNNILGTLFAFGGDLKLLYQRQRYSSQEGDFCIDWYPKIPSFSRSEKAKIVIFLPGLGLCSDSKSTKKFVYELSLVGYFCAVLNPRGWGVPHRAASTKLWYPGLYEDLEFLLSSIESTYGADVTVYLVGYSSGSQIIQRTLQRRHDQRKKDAKTDIIKGAMCVCVVQDYQRTRDRLEANFLIGAFFSMCIAHKFKQLIHQGRHLFDNSVSSSSLESALSSNITIMSELDHWAARYFGHSSELEYYKAVSSTRFDHVTVPMLLVQPADDPLHSADLNSTIDKSLFLSSPHIVYCEQTYGNHFGFLEGSLIDALQLTQYLPPAIVPDVTPTSDKNMNNDLSYIYPAKLAIEFFNHIEENQ